VVVLAGLGWALYAWLPAAPEWTLEGAFRPLGFATDGRTYWTTAYQGETAEPYGPVQGWDLATGREVLRIFPDLAIQRDVQFSRDGRHVAAVGWRQGRNQELWCADLVTGRESGAAIPASAFAWCVCFSPDGNYVLLVETSGGHQQQRVDEIQVLLFDTEPLRLLSKRRVNPTSWKWLPGNSALVTYDAPAEGPALLHRVDRNGATVAMLAGAGMWQAITPDGQTLITLSSPQPDETRSSLLVWDLTGIERPGPMPRRIPGYLVNMGLELLADGRTIVFGQQAPGAEPVVVVWDLDAHRPLGEIAVAAGETPVLAASRDRDRFAVVCSNGPAGASRVALYASRPMRMLGVYTWTDESRHIFAHFHEGTRLLAVHPLGVNEEILLLDSDTAELRLTLRGSSDGWVTHVHGPRLAVSEIIAPQNRPRSFGDAMTDLIRVRVLGRTPAGMERSMSTRVYDTDRGVQIARFDASADMRVDLSDGSLVLCQADELTDDDRATIRCYTVPPRRPWAIIAGIPLASGVLLLGLGIVWRRARRGRTVRTAGHAAAKA
jgi:hypothetical protein